MQYTDNPPGARLDGDAIIRIPEFEISADAVAFDGKSLKDFTEARGRGNVNLRLSPTPKSGQEAIQIRSKSDEAHLHRHQSHPAFKRRSVRFL